VTEVSADDDGRLSSINSEDIEQLYAAYSPAENVITEGSIDGGSEAGDCLVSSMLDYISLEQFSNPLTDEPPAQTETMIADYVFILYDGQYRIAKYQQEVYERGSDDKLAWRLKQRKLNYESARMELIRLYSGELELKLTAEFPIIDEDQAVLST
jgi:hypothetical protein